MPAVLGGPIANALHLPASVFFGLFSAALLLSSAVGPLVGRLIERQGGRGLQATANLAAASLVGPAQVGARIVEFGLLRCFHPISLARLASALHPIGAAFLVMFGAPGIITFSLLHGTGNGMIRIAKGTLPLAVFGPQGYGLRSGLLSASARTVQASAPFLFGLLLDRAGDRCAVGLSTLFALPLLEGFEPVVERAAKPAPELRSEGARDSGLDHVHAPDQQCYRAGRDRRGPGLHSSLASMPKAISPSKDVAGPPTGFCGRRRES